MRKLTRILELLLAVFFITFALASQAAVNVNVNGSTYSIPQTNEKGWGANLTAWIQAISANALTPVGGSFILTNDLNFGASYGLISPYYKSRSANSAGIGVLRLANTDTVAWRNFANTANLILAVNGSDQLTFNGNPIIGSSALTASRVLQSDSSGVISASSVTSTTLGFLDATSSVQTQLNGKADTSALSSHTSSASGVHGVTGSVVGTTDAQTLSAKTLTAPVVNGGESLQELAAAPATPASGYKKIYAKSDGKMYTLSSAGVEKVVGSGAGGGSCNVGVLTNCGFEDGPSVGHTLGTGVSAASNSSDFFEGILSTTLTLSSTNGAVISQSLTPAVNYYGQNLEWSIRYRTTLTTLSICATYAGVEQTQSCLALPATTGNGWQFASFNYPAPGNGAYGYVVKTSSSTSGVFLADDIYVGPARNIGLATPGVQVGNLKWIGATSCTWIAAGGSGFINFPVDTDCDTPTATGIVQAPATKIPAVVIPNAYGKYKVTAVFTMGKTQTTDAAVYVRMSDGVTNSSPIQQYVGINQYGVPTTLTSVFEYSGSPADKTIQLQGAAVSGTSVQVAPNTANFSGMEFVVERIPSQAEQAVRLNAPVAYAAKTWYGASFGPAVGASAAASTTRTTLSGAAWSTYTRYGGAVDDLSQNLQVTATLPQGDYTAKFDGFMRAISNPNPTTSTTCVYEIWDGTSVIASSYVQGVGGTDTRGSQIPSLAGAFTVPSGGATKTLVLRVAKVAGDNNAGSYCQFYTNAGEQNAMLSITPLSQAVPNLFLPSSVISGTSGIERVERARVTCGTSSSVLSSSSPWLSISAMASNRCTITMPAGIWSATPTCTANMQTNETTIARATHLVTASATSIGIGCVLVGGGGPAACPGPDSFDLICIGPR